MLGAVLGSMVGLAIIAIIVLVHKYRKRDTEKYELESELQAVSHQMSGMQRQTAMD